MPIITFLRDIIEASKGRYYRTVGRHTQNFCSEAVKIAKNDTQKRIFFVTAICADEFIAALLGVDNKKQVKPFGGRIVKQKLQKQQIAAALRIYISGILTLLSSYKQILLTATGMQETELLHAWCKVFDYSPADMEMFDTILLPAYQQGGINAVSRLVGKNILDLLFVTNEEMTLAEAEFLQDIMLEDVTAVVKNVQNYSRGA